VLADRISSGLHQATMRLRLGVLCMSIPAWMGTLLGLLARSRLAEWLLARCTAV
jgi:hypothetical protein